MINHILWNMRWKIYKLAVCPWNECRLQNSEVSGVLVHWVGSGTTVGFMEVFSTDLRPCLPPRWLRPWNSPSPSWLVMGTFVLPYTLLLAENRKYWWQLSLVTSTDYHQHFLWNAECIWQCILYKRWGPWSLERYIWCVILCCNILGEWLLKAEKEKCGRYFESEWLPSCRSGSLIPTSLPGITNNSTVSQNILHQMFLQQNVFTKIWKVLTNVFYSMIAYLRQ